MEEMNLNTDAAIGENQKDVPIDDSTSNDTPVTDNTANRIDAHAAAKIFDRPLETIRDWRKRGKLPAVKVGNEFLFLKSDVLKLRDSPFLRIEVSVIVDKPVCCDNSFNVISFSIKIFFKASTSIFIFMHFL